MKKSLGFTLAEVLITLGIIGIVSAITIPSLVSKYNRYIVETRLKDIYSTILQAYKMAQYNEVALTDAKLDDADVNGYSYTLSKAIFEQMFVPVFSGGTIYPQNSAKFKFYSADGSTFFGTNSYEVYYPLNNGTVIGFMKGGNYDGMTFKVIINPQKNKLLAGKDYFILTFRNDGNDNYSYLQLFRKQYDNPQGRLKLLEYCKSNNRYPANSSPAEAFCTHAIVQNGFKIPDNYPIKF